MFHNYKIYWEIKGICFVIVTKLERKETKERKNCVSHTNTFTVPPYKCYPSPLKSTMSVIRGRPTRVSLHRCFTTHPEEGGGRREEGRSLTQIHWENTRGDEQWHPVWFNERPAHCVRISDELTPSSSPPPRLFFPTCAVSSFFYIFPFICAGNGLMCRDYTRRWDVCLRG